jgi:hypothetical protein
MKRFGQERAVQSMRIIAKIAVGSALSLTLMACAETTVMNKLGMGKSPPDESQVVTNNTLAMPPDLQLRAPSAAPADQPQAGTQIAAVPTTPPDAFAAPAPDASAPVADGTEQTAYDTGEQQLSTDADMMTTASVSTQSAPAVQSGQKTGMSQVNPREDAYQKFGISKTRPDGTPKTQAELDRELLEAVRQEKRKQNPNYGTVFNMGELFKKN